MLSLSLIHGLTDWEEQLINTVVGRNAVEVGTTLEPCTTTIRSVKHPYLNDDEGRQVIFVDTPALQHDEYQTLDALETQLNAWMKKA
jgi:GTPase Era involved in 16S rRNA processing